VVLLADMTGDPAFDAHLRAATDGIVPRLRARGYELAAPQAVGAAMQRGVTDPAALRTALGAELAVRTNVRYRDRDRAVVQVSVLSAAAPRSQDLTGTGAELAASIPAAVEALLPAPGTTAAPAAMPPAAGPSTPAAPQAAALDKVVLKDGTIIEGRVMHQAPGSFVVVQAADGRQRTIHWDRVSEVLAAAPAASAPTWSAPAPAAAPAAPAPLPAPANQQQWDKRGGHRFTIDAAVQVVGLLQRVDTTVNKTFTSGEKMTFSGSSNAGGGGGGVGVHLGYLYLAAPDIAKSTTWTGFRLGTGFDLAYVAFGHRTDATIQSGLRDASGNILIPGSAEGGETRWGSSLVVMVPLTIGGQFGFGKFWGDTRWNGTTLGLDYRPTYFYSKPSELKSATDGFNPLGMQLTLDIGSLEVEARSEANFRFSAVVLPPVGGRPTLVTLGFGAAWY
jgi:hypothetical protein